MTDMPVPLLVWPVAHEHTAEPALLVQTADASQPPLLVRHGSAAWVRAQQAGMIDGCVSVAACMPALVHIHTHALCVCRQIQARRTWVH